MSANRSVILDMPWPPTVNNVWRVAKGRAILSDKARSYRKAVCDSVLVNRIPRYPLNGRLSVTMLAHPPDGRTRDLDNLLKASIDALRHAGVIADDGLIDSIYIGRRKVSARNGFLSVVVCEMETAA